MGSHVSQRTLQGATCDSDLLSRRPAPPNITNLFPCSTFPPVFLGTFIVYMSDVVFGRGNAVLVPYIACINLPYSVLQCIASITSILKTTSVKSSAKGVSYVP